MVGKVALRGIARQRFRKAELAPGMVGRRKGCRAGLTMGPQRGRGASRWMPGARRRCVTTSHPGPASDS